jgi:hypothetical protein
VRLRVGAIPSAAEEVLAAPEPDASDIGVNYTDACLKVFKQALDDGRKLACKRRGLKLTLTLGERRGEGLLRRLEHGPDVRDILRHALVEAARDAGLELTLEDGVFYLDIDD